MIEKQDIINGLKIVLKKLPYKEIYLTSQVDLINNLINNIDNLKNHEILAYLIECKSILTFSLRDYFLEEINILDNLINDVLKQWLFFDNHEQLKNFIKSEELKYFINHEI